MRWTPLVGTRVLGIGHKARHGKDTAATTLLRAIPRARRIGFADDLYTIARIRHGMTAKDPALLQRLGLEYRDEFGADVWIRSVYLKLCDDPAPLVVIPDVRFPNELDFIRSLGGIALRVQRICADGSLYQDPSRDPLHPSETLLDTATWDHTIQNHDGHLPQFCADVLTFVQHLP